MINTLREFARDSARRYLQSAVFVDDKIFDKHSGMPVDLTDLPKPRKPVYRAESEETIPLAGDQEEPDRGESNQTYHPKDLVSSFARAGIICALYEPPEGFSTNPDSEIFKLCERADIVILDWDFSKDKGEKALDLITALVRQSHEELPHHTRLFSIYTDDPSLVAVADQIDDRLGKVGFKAEPQQSPCRLQSGATRLVVFGKALARFGNEEEKFTVKESDLADRLIDEFTDMNAGILPSYALHGMAAIRRNSRRILDRFHGGMDGAFLLHRALLMETEDAFEQLPELLSEELLAVVDDAHGGITKIQEGSKELALTCEVGSPGKSWCDKKGKPFDASPIIREILTNGLEGLSGESKNCQQASNLAKSGWRRVDAQIIRDLHSMVDPGSTGSNQRLASLFTARTQYGDKARQLSYGTVVRHREAVADDSPWIYSFCLMPACDAIRLNLTRQFKEKIPVAFPFWKLKEDVYSGNALRRGLVIELPDKSYIELSAGGKARDMLWMASFEPNETTGTVAAERKNNRFVFVSDRNLEIEWIGQLKPLHAQRIAHDIGQSLSRVGLVEAEWLRLLCDR